MFNGVPVVFLGGRGEILNWNSLITGLVNLETLLSIFSMHRGEGIPQRKSPRTENLLEHDETKVGSDQADVENLLLPMQCLKHSDGAPADPYAILMHCGAATFKSPRLRRTSCGHVEDFEATAHIERHLCLKTPRL